MGALLAGFARWFSIGVAWGALARLFMRLVSTEPGFSWAGTLGIVGTAAVFFGLVGVVVAARRARRSGWWRLAPVPGLILFAGPGLPLLPGSLLIALGLAAARASRRAVAASLLLLGTVGTYAMLTLLDDDRFLAPRTQTAGYVLIVVAVTWMGATLHAWWRRWPDGVEPATAEGVTTAEASPAAYGRI